MAQIFDTPIYTSDQSIDRVMKTGMPLMVVFFDAPLSPELDSSLKKLAKEHAGALLVVQMSRRDNPETAKRFAVTSTPALIAYKSGQVLSQAVNFTTSDLDAHARYLLGRGPKPEPKQPAQTSATNGRANQSSAQAPEGSTAGSRVDHPVSVTDATFDQEVMRSQVPVVVDFWAPWCGPCRMVAPTLDKLAREWKGRVKIAKVNVDENPASAGRYGVRSIPTMIVVVNGQIVDNWAGALPEPALRSRLSAALRQNA